MDRASQLTKPAGHSRHRATTVSQSGVSKQLDHVGGNKLLSKIAGVLQQAEETMVEFVAIVLGNGKANQAAIDGTTISYPTSST